jgi:hypothetical protein
MCGSMLDRCVYRKLKLGHNGDAVRQGSRGNGYFQLVELGARKARPYLASDAFAIHYNRRHTRLESGAGALRPVPLTFQAIIIWRDELNDGKVLLRDIDLDATYAGVPPENHIRA